MGIFNTLFGGRKQSSFSKQEFIVICAQLKSPLEKGRSITFHLIVSLLIYYDVLPENYSTKVASGSQADIFVRGFQLAVTSGYAQRYMDVDSWLLFDEIYSITLGGEYPENVSNAREKYLNCHGDRKRLAASLIGDLFDSTFGIRVSDVPQEAFEQLWKLIENYGMSSQAFVAQSFGDLKSADQLIRIAERSN